MAERIGEGTRRVGTASAGGKSYEVFEPERKAPPKPTQSEFTLTPEMKRRQQYEQFITEKYNVPVGVGRGQISQWVNSTSKEREEALFESVFGGQYRFEDRNELDPQAQVHWRQSRLKDRKVIEQGFTKGIQEELQFHQDRMKVFDDYMGKASSLVKVPGKDGVVWGEKKAGEKVLDDTTYPKGFNEMLGKHQSLRGKLSKLESGMTEFGISFKKTPEIVKAMDIVKKDIARQEGFMKKRYPKAWKDYSGGVEAEAPKPLDRETAMKLLKEAGGDKAKARELAKQQGYTF